MDLRKGVQEATPFSLSDFLLPKSGRIRGPKTLLIIDDAVSVWVIKETQILPKLSGGLLANPISQGSFTHRSLIKDASVLLGYGKKIRGAHGKSGQ
jgi:hypothetical protein